MIIDWGGSYQEIDNAWTYEIGVGSAFQFYGYVMDGGGIVGGIADSLKAAFVAMSGGGIAGGEATMTKARSIVGEGGGISGGAANVLGTLGRSGDGGTVSTVLIMVNE